MPAVPDAAHDDVPEGRDVTRDAMVDAAMKVLLNGPGGVRQGYVYLTRDLVAEAIDAALHTAIDGVTVDITQRGGERHVERTYRGGPGAGDARFRQ